jgi:hypothetical protein
MTCSVFSFRNGALGLILAASLSISLPASAAALGGGGGGSEPTQADDGRRRSLTSSESYVPLPALTATVQTNYRARGLMQIEAGLEIEDGRLRRHAEHSMPRLRDAYVTALGLYAGVNYQFGDVPDADRIAELLQEATDHALGQEGAQVLLGMIIIHSD